MALPVTHRPGVAAGALDVMKIHHMLYEAALWRVQAWNSETVSADAFVNEWHTTFFFGAVHGLVGPLAGPLAEKLIRRWAQTETVETADSAKLQALTNSFTKQLCAQFWRTLHTQGPSGAEGYLHAQEGLRNEARNKVLTMIQSANNHDKALAQEAENVRVSLVVLLYACEVAGAIVGFFTVTPAAAAIVGITAEIGMPLSAALWAVPALSLGVSEAENLIIGPPKNWKVVALSLATTAGSKRAWAYHAFPLEKRLQSMLAQRKLLVEQVSRQNLQEAFNQFRSGRSPQDTARNMASVDKARAALAANEDGVDALARSLRIMKATNTYLPLVFTAASVFQSTINLRKRLNS